MYHVESNTNGAIQGTSKAETVLGKQADAQIREVFCSSYRQIGLYRLCGAIKDVELGVGLDVAHLCGRRIGVFEPYKNQGVVELLAALLKHGRKVGIAASVPDPAIAKEDGIYLAGVRIAAGA